MPIRSSRPLRGARTGRGFLGIVLVASTLGVLGALSATVSQRPVHLSHTSLAGSGGQANYESVVEGQAPAYFWPMQDPVRDPPSTTVSDIAGQNNGVNNGAQIQQNGPFGSCPNSCAYSFTGQPGSWLDFPDYAESMLDTHSFTLSMWIDPRPNPPENSQTLFHVSQYGYQLTLNGTGPFSLKGTIFDSAAPCVSTSPSVIQPNAWSFVAFTFSGPPYGGSNNTCSVYVDGSLQATTNSEGDIQNGDNDYFWVTMASQQGDADPFFAGSMANAAYWYSVLTPQQIAQECQAGGACPPVSSQPQGALTAAEQYGGGSPSESHCRCTSGEPIDNATGDFYETETDLSVPGPGVPLSFTRTYDALAAQAEEGAAAPAGPLGYGWTDNFNMGVTWSATTGLATVTEENGAQITFERFTMGQPETSLCQWTGCWCPSDANGPVFCPVAPRILASLANSSFDANGNPTGSWTFTRDVKDPMTYDFSSSGSLTQVSDGQLNTLTPTPYTGGQGLPPCPAGDSCTAWTSSASGRSIVLAKNTATGYLDQVFEPQTGASQPLGATYSYSGTGCAWGSNPVDLCSVTSTPSGFTTSFQYTGSGAQAWDISKVVPPSTGTITNTYYSNGQIKEQDTTTGSSTTQVMTFAYGTTTVVANGTTTTVSTFPQGTGGSSDQTVYTYSNGLLVSTSVGGLAPTDLSPDSVSLLPATTIDPDGNPVYDVFSRYDQGGTATSSADVTSSTDGTGVTNFTDYTAANLPWCHVSAAESSAGVSCPPSQPSMPSAGTLGSVYTSGSSSTYGNDGAVGPTLTYYDSAGHVLGATDPRGYTDKTAYTSAGLPWCTVDAFEYSVNQVSCGPAPPSQPPTGQRLGYTTTLYDSSGDVTSVTDPDGATKNYQYTNASYPWIPTVVTDPSGTTTTSTLDAAGQVISKVVAYQGFSATTSYQYDASGRLYCTVAPDAQGQASCPSTPPTNPPSAGSDPWPGVTVSIYDPDGRVVDSVNQRGGVTQYAYDQAGNRYCTVTPNNYANGITCPGVGYTVPTAGSDLYKGAALDTFDSAGRVIQQTNALGGITSTSYDATGNALQVQVIPTTADGSGLSTVTTQYGYDADNRVVTTTVGTAHPATTKQSYGPDGNIFCSLSSNNVANGGQCPTWQPSWMTAPPSATTLSSAGTAKATVSIDDPSGNVVESVDPDLQLTATEYDADGRSYCTVDPSNVAARIGTYPNFPYACSQVVLPISTPSQNSDPWPNATVTVYDPAGRTLSSTDQLGDTTAYSYDAAGQKTSEINPDGNATSYCYYSEAQGCASQAPSGGGTGDDLYSATTPGTTPVMTTHTYAPGGQVATTTTPAGTEIDNYDRNGDLTSKTYPVTASGYTAASAVTIAYNVDASRAQMIDGTGTTTYGYDALGDQTSQAFTPQPVTGLKAQTLGHTFYSNGDLATVTYPSYPGHSQPPATYTYNELGNMASVSDWLGHTTTFGFDGDANLTCQESNSGGTSNPCGQNPGSTATTTTMSYDPADQLASTNSTFGQSCTGSQSFSGSFGSRNPDGQVTRFSGSACLSSASFYDNYDAAGRLVYQGPYAQGQSPNNFAYDAAGNPTTITYSPSKSGFYDTYTQAFDSAGSGQLQTQTPITGSQGSTTNYQYDTLGDQATAAVAAGTTSTYNYDQLGHLTGANAVQTASSGSYPLGYLVNGDGLEAATASDASGWNATNVGASHTLTSVSCPTATFCAVVDNKGNAITGSGNTWTSSSIGTAALNAVSCTSNAFCMAVDNSGGAHLDVNGSWSTRQLNNGGKSVTGVSCTSSLFCVAVDTKGKTFAYNGSGWGNPVQPTGALGHAFTSVSCSATAGPVATLCVAVNNAGMAFTSSDGVTWSAGSDVDGSTSITTVSCATPTFCEAVDATGHTLNAQQTPQGLSWTVSPNALDAQKTLQGISCPTATFCITVDSAGNDYVFDGVAWSSSWQASTRGLNGVSCATESWCTAISGTKGDIFTPPTTQTVWDTTGSLPNVATDGVFDFIYGPTGEPIEQVLLATSAPQFMLFTPSANSWTLSDATGTVHSYVAYDATGTLGQFTSYGNWSPFGYGGQYTDSFEGGQTTSASGLVNMRARWYQPTTGEFMTVDPALQQTDQAYVYAGDDPVNGSDPSGLDSSGSLGYGWSPVSGTSGVPCPTLSASFASSPPQPPPPPPPPVAVDVSNSSSNSSDSAQGTPTPSGCQVPQVSPAHYAKGSNNSRVKVNAYISCDEPVESLELSVEIWKSGFLWSHFVTSTTPSINFNEASITNKRTEATCTSKRSSTYWGEAYGEALDQGVWYSSGWNGPSRTLDCGT